MEVVFVFCIQRHEIFDNMLTLSTNVVPGEYIPFS